MAKQVIDHDAQFRAMYSELEDLWSKNELLQENLSDVVNAMDNVGWVPLGGNYEVGRGVPLAALKNWSDFNQQLLAINPLVKRGASIRCSYIFGEEIEWQKDSPRAKKLRDKNAELIFSNEGLTQLEKAFMATGNNFLLLDRTTQKIARIPLSEITNVAVVPDSKEDVLYWQRTWVEPVNENKTTAHNGQTRSVTAWYPVPDIDPQWLMSSIDGDTVVLDKAMLHLSVNKQVGWLYGVADIQPAVFWAKAYKEFLEANFTLVRALAKFTFKMSAATPAGARRAAAKVSAATPYDASGQRSGTGTAILGAGEDLQAINKAGANVNFDAGKPLAAMVAAALEVDVDDLLSDGSNAVAKDTLNISLLKAMVARQAIFKRGFQKIFTYFGIPNIIPKFPPIQWEVVHRMVQAVVLAASTNAIHPEETRGLLINIMRQYGIDPKAALPADGRNAEFVTGINAAEQAQQQADLAQQGMDNQASAADAKAKSVNSNPGTSPQKTPKGSSSPGKGKRSPAGPTADGDHGQRKSQGK